MALQIFKLTEPLYGFYLKGLLVASFLSFRDRAKAYAITEVTGVHRDLNEIYRYINLRRLYNSLGATSPKQRKAVQAALQVYYTRKSRGSNVSGMVSMWVNRGGERITESAQKVLAHYQLANQEALMEIESGMYVKDAGNGKCLCVIPLQFEMTKTEVDALLKLVDVLDEESAAQAAKKPRKPRTPDSEVTKAKKRSAALARQARARAAQV
jgi:hypothetical protein